jgi:hypothetical protein
MDRAMSDTLRPFRSPIAWMAIVVAALTATMVVTGVAGLVDDQGGGRSSAYGS